MRMNPIVHFNLFFASYLKQYMAEPRGRNCVYSRVGGGGGIAKLHSKECRYKEGQTLGAISAIYQF